MWPLRPAVAHALSRSKRDARLVQPVQRIPVMVFPGPGSPFALLRYRQVQQGQYHLVDFVVVVVHLHTPAEHDGSAGLEIGQSGKASAVCVLKMGRLSGLWGRFRASLTIGWAEFFGSPKIWERPPAC